MKKKINKYKGFLKVKKIKNQKWQKKGVSLNNKIHKIKMQINLTLFKH